MVVGPRVGLRYPILIALYVDEELRDALQMLVRLESEQMPYSKVDRQQVLRRLIMDEYLREVSGQTRP